MGGIDYHTASTMTLDEIMEASAAIDMIEEMKKTGGD